MIWTDSCFWACVSGQEAKESGHIECEAQSVLQEHDLKAQLPPIRPSS